MARGTEAKKIIADKITAALADCYVGEQDKKLYFSAKENGETVQIAVSLTCPKNMIEPSGESPKRKANFDWSGSPSSTTTATVSDEDQKKIEELMKRLGIDS